MFAISPPFALFQLQTSGGVSSGELLVVAIDGALQRASIAP
jgi:hypothetical protein